MVLCRRGVVGETEISLVQGSVAAFCLSRNILERDAQPFIHLWSINRVPASAEFMALTSPLSGGR